MLNQKIILSILFFALFFLFLSNSSNFASEETTIKASNEKLQKKVASIKLKIKAYDSDLNKISNRIKLFARVSDPIQSNKKGYLIPSDKIVSVSDPNSWPEDTVNSYIILLDESGFIATFEDVPSSESGDWSNSYTHYFDSKGNTLAFKRYSGFFMGCPADVSKETSIYYYGENYELVQKEYSLVDNDGVSINPKECEFMYRHEYKIYKNISDLTKDIGV